MPTNTEAKALQARRKAAATAAAADTPPVTPVTVGAEEPARHYEALGDPREPRVQVGTISDGNQFSRPHPLASPARDVAEASGFYAGHVDSDDSDDFVVAECDAYEQILPKGCTTPTSRMRWAKGQHVPVATYRAWQAQQAQQVAELETAPVAPADPPPPPA